MSHESQNKTPGWFHPAGYSKRHYDTGEGKTLCGRAFNYSVLTYDDHNNPENCTQCKAKLLKQKQPAAR